jgi:hypothetical protein
MPEYFGDMEIGDLLRQSILVPGSSKYEIFSDSKRQEFIFHLFKFLVGGGPLCQYEDTLQPYLDATKLVYKDVVAACKDPQTGKAMTYSQVYQLTDIVTSENSNLFLSKKYPQVNTCYLSIDKFRRTITILYSTCPS